MNRITRPQMFLEIAGVAAKRSTCYRANVGAVLVKDGNVVSIGYNGPPSGERHCTGLTCERTESGGCARAVHAEVNAIERAPAQLVEGATLFVTYSPCAACAMKIVSSGIHKVYYQIPYRDSFGIQILVKESLTVGRVTPNGMVVDELTKELVEVP